MMTEKCTDCLHELVCGLPCTTIHEDCCPGFLDKNKCELSINSLPIEDK